MRFQLYRTAVVPLLLLCHTSLAVERRYHVAAVKITWSYGNQQENRSGSTYSKAVYREYDAGFQKPKEQPSWQGLLGPTLRAQEGDVLIVTFRNMADRDYSIHPHGIAYGKQSEGSLYFDNTSPFEKEDDRVKPGQQHTYYWEVTAEVAPKEADPPCLTYTYMSHNDIVRDYNSGLVGTLLICKKDSLSESGEQLHFTHEFVLLFGVFDESKSWYGASPQADVKYTLNGYSNGTIPDVSLCAYASVSWHLLGMSSQPELFSVHFNGHVLQHANHKVSSVGLISGSATSVNATAIHPGRWLLSSFITKHQEAGLHGFVDVHQCLGIDPPQQRRLTFKEKRKIEVWTYYIAAEETIWDYAPNVPKYIDSEYQTKYLKGGQTRIGSRYKKAVFVEYVNETFMERKENKQRKMETGILGPAIRAQIRDLVKIVFKNMASRPYSIYPHGLTIDKNGEGANYPTGGNQAHSVQPGETFVYEWKVTEEDEPTESDARCLTRMYHSAVDTPRDIASGLIGPLLICKGDSLTKKNVQLKADKEQQAVLAVFDENKSWYFDENIQTFCGDPSKVNKEDIEFYDSNVMHTINGYVYDSGQVLGFCDGEIVTWHVSSVGAQDHIQTATFYGHDFELNNRIADVLSLFPMSGETITMAMDNIGHWLLASLNPNEAKKGVRLKFKDLECYRDYYTDYEIYTKAVNIWQPEDIEEIKHIENSIKPESGGEDDKGPVDEDTEYWISQLGIRSFKNKTKDDMELLDLSMLAYDDVVPSDDNVSLNMLNRSTTSNLESNETLVQTENLTNASFLTESDMGKVNKDMKENENFWVHAEVNLSKNDGNETYLSGVTSNETTEETAGDINLTTSMPQYKNLTDIINSPYIMYMTDNKGNDSMSTEEDVYVMEVLKPHGNRGEVKDVTRQGTNEPSTIRPKTLDDSYVMPTRYNISTEEPTHVLQVVDPVDSRDVVATEAPLTEPNIATTRTEIDTEAIVQYVANNNTGSNASNPEPVSIITYSVGDLAHSNLTGNDYQDIVLLDSDRQEKFSNSSTEVDLSAHKDLGHAHSISSLTAAPDQPWSNISTTPEAEPGTDRDFYSAVEKNDSNAVNESLSLNITTDPTSNSSPFSEAQHNSDLSTNNTFDLNVTTPQSKDILEGANMSYNESGKENNTVEMETVSFVLLNTSDQLKPESLSNNLTVSYSANFTATAGLLNASLTYINSTEMNVTALDTTTHIHRLNSGSEEESESSLENEDVVIYPKNSSQDAFLSRSVDQESKHWTYDGKHNTVNTEIPNHRKRPNSIPDKSQNREKGKLRYRVKPVNGSTLRLRKKKTNQQSMISPRGHKPSPFSPRGARPITTEEELSKSAIVIGVPRQDFNEFELYTTNHNNDFDVVNVPDENDENDYEYVNYKDPYSPKAEVKSVDETIKYFLQMASENTRAYFIAAEEVQWDYEGYGQRRQERMDMDEGPTKFKKVVFRGYLDSNFTTPDIRGEVDEHLGILGPIIKAEVDETIMVFFKNFASRPYSLHAHGVSYSKQMEGMKYEDNSPYWYRHDDEVKPGSVYTYVWKAEHRFGPMAGESDCRTWAYYSSVNQERDINSGLIGPLLICRKGTLRQEATDMREFVLLFMTFDETKSWYYEKNMEKIPRKRSGLVKHRQNLKFHAINGIIYSLKGLRMYTNQLVRWHLLNLGSQEEVHSIHFHGQTFLDKQAKEYRQAVHQLLPGTFSTLEMTPSKPGLWLLESEVGEFQQNGMQTLFLVLDIDCGHPMGLVSQSVKDNQITASQHTGEWKPHLARLHNSGKHNAWSTENSADWIQVDFQRPVVISKVATQGAKQLFTSHYVQNFTVSYSTDKKTWTFYKGSGKAFRMTFTGNEDSHQAKENTFFPPLIGRYVRLHPQQSYNRPTLRMELYGCELDGCSVPLGMESKEIEDTQIRASSVASSLFHGSWQPWFGRLNNQGKTNAWQAKHNNMQQWLQVELKHIKKITGIVTQGAKSLGSEMYVMSYIIQYSDDGRAWKTYTDENEMDLPKVFLGNTDNNSHVKNYIYPPIFSRYIRVVPQRWQKAIMMRIELLGCDFE